jgi:putative membrane protein
MALLLFIALLPFSVIEYFGLLEVPLVVAVSACFLLIEKMAIHLQDPFENKPTDTPMTTIAKSIEKNLLQLYGLQSAKRKWANRELQEQDQKEEKVLRYLTKKMYYQL